MVRGLTRQSQFIRFQVPQPNTRRCCDVPHIMQPDRGWGATQLPFAVLHGRHASTMFDG